MKLFETITEERALNLSSLTLAFIGDAAYTLLTRKNLALSCDGKSGLLHKTAAKSVSAPSQSALAAKIMPHLTDDEILIYKRARNAKKGSKAKNSTASDYNRSTGLEALIGYLYLTGAYERLEFLLEIGEANES